MSDPVHIEAKKANPAPRRGLCDKRHDNVMADITKMLQDIGVDALTFQDIYKDARNRDQTEYHLPKDLTVTLITGYRADLRYRVVKRMEELEGQDPRKPGGKPRLARGFCHSCLIWCRSRLSAQLNRLVHIEAKEANPAPRRGLGQIAGRFAQRWACGKPTLKSTDRQHCPALAII